MSVDNMNKTISAKYGILPEEVEKCSLSPEEVEKRALSSENFRLGFNFDQIKTVQKQHNALDKHHAKLYL